MNKPTMKDTCTTDQATYTVTTQVLTRMDPLKTAAENAAKRSAAYGSKKFQQVVDDSPSNPRSKNFDPKTLQTP